MLISKPPRAQRCTGENARQSSHTKQVAVEKPARIAGSATFGIDLPAGAFHSVLVRAFDTVIYEVKPGPYTAMDDKDFASWAPAEGTPEVAAYLTLLDHAVTHWQTRTSR